MNITIMRLCGKYPMPMMYMTFFEPILGCNTKWAAK
jgi:hypothetical protein